MSIIRTAIAAWLDTRVVVGDCGVCVNRATEYRGGTVLIAHFGLQQHMAYESLIVLLNITMECYICEYRT